MAVRPGRRPAGRGAGLVPRVVLDEQHERPVGVAAVGDVPFGTRHVLERAPEVDRRRPAQPVGDPWHGAVERPVELEHAGAVAERLVATARPFGQAIASDRDRGPRRRVEEDDSRRGHLGQPFDPVVRHDLPAERPELRRQRVGHGGRPATDHRPPDGVRVQPQHEPERRGQRPVERDHGVRRQPGEQGAGRLAAETAAGERLGRPQRRDPEPGQRQGMARRVEDRAQQLAGQLVGVPGDGLEQRAPGAAVVRAAVGVEPRGRRGERPLQDGGPPAVQRVRHRRIGMHEFHAMRRQVDGPEER